jgi:glutamine amidotransferase PdxT
MPEHVQISDEERREVFLYLEKMFVEEVRKNLHVSDIKTEIVGLYAIRVTVEKNTFTRDEVSFLFSLTSSYVRKRLEVNISFIDRGGIELFIVPKQRLISYYAKRLKYY